jgi:catechol 2,3-dioxygenase-like lactoylglutathione lyase family enzyme
MTVELNHTIVHATDNWAAARDVADVLGLAEPSAFGPFAVLELSNGVSLDFMVVEGEIGSQHYAFLVTEDEFDAIHGRLRQAGRQWWADPAGRRPGEINHNDGGRGLYWKGPDGHWLEIITRPYGSDS